MSKLVTCLYTLYTPSINTIRGKQNNTQDQLATGGNWGGCTDGKLKLRKWVGVNVFNFIMT